MIWNRRYAMEQQHYDYIKNAAQKFYDDGGTVEVHHLDTLQGPSKGLAKYFDLQSSQIDSTPSNALKGFARENISRDLDELSKAYSSGQPAAPGRKTLVAKDKNNNVIGTMSLLNVGCGQWLGVRGTASLGGGVGTALQHALVHGVLKTTGQSLSSEIYSQSNRSDRHHWTPKDNEIQNNARQFHENLGRSTGWQDGTDINSPAGASSWWTKKDVGNIVDNTHITNTSIRHFLDGVDRTQLILQTGLGIESADTATSVTLPLKRPRHTTHSHKYTHPDYLPQGFDPQDPAVHQTILDRTKEFLRKL